MLLSDEVSFRGLQVGLGVDLSSDYLLRDGLGVYEL